MPVFILSIGWSFCGWLCSFISFDHLEPTIRLWSNEGDGMQLVPNNFVDASTVGTVFYLFIMPALLFVACYDQSFPLEDRIRWDVRRWRCKKYISRNWTSTDRTGKSRDQSDWWVLAKFVKVSDGTEVHAIATTSRMNGVYGRVFLTKSSLFSLITPAFSPVLRLDNHEFLGSHCEESSAIAESKLSNTDEWSTLRIVNTNDRSCKRASSEKQTLTSVGFDFLHKFSRALPSRYLSLVSVWSCHPRLSSLGNQRSGKETGNSLPFTRIFQWRTSRTYRLLDHSTERSHESDHDDGTSEDSSLRGKGWIASLFSSCW